MAFKRRQSGLDISGASKGRGRRIKGGPSGGAKLFSPSQSRSQRKSQQAALSRAAKGRGSYIQPSSYAKREGRFSRKTKIGIIAVVVVALLVSITVGFFVYQQTAKNALKPTLNTKALAGELAEPSSDKGVSWGVLVCTDASSAEAGRGSVKEIALVGIDTDNIALSFMWIPTNTRVYIDGSGYKTISDAFKMGGEVTTTVAVEKLADIEVHHYYEINEAGLKKLEDSLAPLAVDPQTAGRDQLAFSICRKLFGSSSEQINSMADLFMTCVATDATSDQVKATFKALHGINMDTSCFSEEMPTTLQTIDGIEYSVCNTDKWNTMILRVGNGMSPVASAAEVDMNNVIRGNCTVTIWNGVGVSGVAADCANELRSLGWNVIQTGNANQYIYDETFVVYKDTDDAAAARLLAADLGQGRVIRSYARYAYTGNLLVVIGKDYKPY